MLWEIRNNHQWQRPPSPKKKKKEFEGFSWQHVTKVYPVYSRPLPSNKIGERDRLPDFRDIFLRYHDGDVNENVKKAIRWIGRKTTVHAFFTLFCTFLYRHYMTMTLKCLISRFTGDVNKRRRNFLSLSELEYGCLEFGSVRARLHLTK